MIAFAAATVSMTVLLAGCAGSAATPQNSIATEAYKATYSDAPAGDCPANATDPAIAALRTVKPRTPLPADFQPVAALRCTNAYRTDGAGKTCRVNEVQRAGGDLSELISQLRRPDEVKVANTAVGCAAVGQIVPVFGLVDARGTVIRPRFPLGVCGLIQPQVQAAVNALAWKSETTGETKVTTNLSGLTSS
ncbi:MAG TPA: hypothetical protein VFX16_15585, partial [Pseudonocardiaceae bacterium]|nr:hypothetical protein [Pseudonocardiaceae bacterium]